LKNLPNAYSSPKGAYETKTVLSGPGYHIADDVFKPAPATIADIRKVGTVVGNRIKEGTVPLTGELTPSGLAASAVQKKIADYTSNIPASDVIAGDAAAAGAALKKGNAEWMASKKLGIVDALRRNAELQAGSANSGQNINNTTRQQVKSFIKNQRDSRFLTDAEVAAAERAVRGTPFGNTMRGFANRWAPIGALTPTNLAATGAMGALVGKQLGFDPETAGIATALTGQALGKTARGLANASETRQFNKLRNEVLKGSPSGKAALKSEKKDSSRAALIRALLALGAGATP
jgi:hypothetical protein